MKIKDIVKTVSGTVVSGNVSDDEQVTYCFASDLMSDVLTVRRSDFMLITGLANIQSIRTAEMSDVRVVLLVRGKQPSPEMIEEAQDNDILLLSSPFSMFKASGLLYEAGMQGVY